MTAVPDRRRRAQVPVTDLVEYLVIVMPDLGPLTTVALPLGELVEAGMIRILDLVIVVRHSDGEVAVLEFEAVDGMVALTEVEGEVGGVLSDHDIELASLALRPGTAGIVVVTEDRWAEPLSVAVQRAGGQIIGERIPWSRVDAILADRSEERLGGA
jgi:hypothetical protein